MAFKFCLPTLAISALLCIPPVFAESSSAGQYEIDPYANDRSATSAGWAGDPYHVSSATGRQSFHGGWGPVSGQQQHWTAHTGTQTNNAPIIRPWGDNGPNYDGTTSERTGTQAEHSATILPWQDTGPNYIASESSPTSKQAKQSNAEYDSPSVPASCTGALAANTVDPSSIPSGQYSFGFPTQVMTASTLPQTATSSVEFDIVER